MTIATTAAQRTDSPSVDNGVNVDALLGARAMLTEAPLAAQFTFSATNQWVNGTHSRSTVQGIDPDVRNGFSGIRVRFDIDADATREEIQAVVAQSQKRSAVFDIVANPTLIVVDVA